MVMEFPTEPIPEPTLVKAATLQGEAHTMRMRAIQKMGTYTLRSWTG